jgi:adenylate cyclase
MKHKILFSCFVMFYANLLLVAQNRALDSLIHLQQTMPNDTNKANVLLAIINYGTAENAEKLKEFGQTAIQLTEQLGMKKGQSRAYCRYGNLLKTQLNYQKALEFYHKALSIAEQNQDIPYVNICCYNIASAYERHYQNNLALDFYFRSLKISESTRDTVFQLETLNLIGFLYYKMKEYKKGIQVLEKALSINQTMNNLSIDIDAMTYLSCCYLGMENATAATVYLHKVIAILQQQNIQDIRLAQTYINLGVAFEKKKNYDNALLYAQKALRLGNQLKNDNTICNAALNIGSSYFFQKKYRRSLAPNLMAYRIAKKIRELELQKDAAKGISDAYENMGDKAQAFAYLKEYEIMRDSLLNQDRRKEIMQKTINFELEKQHLTDSLIQMDYQKIQYLELSRQKTYTIGSLIALLLATLFGISVFLGLKQNKKERAKSESLLLNILPASVAEELKQQGTTQARLFDNVTVLMTDFVGFTQVSEALNAVDLVAEIDTCFKAFDNIITTHGLEKIKTVGDAYVAVCGIPHSNPYHTAQTVKAALAIRDFMIAHAEKNKDNISLKAIRIGLHTGSVVAGVVGSKKFAYDIWGDTVNTTARMEQNAENQQVNVSNAVFEVIAEDFLCTPRGKIKAKNKGELEMYAVTWKERENEEIT